MIKSFIKKSLNNIHFSLLLVSILSRVTGMLRELIVAYKFGATLITDSYFFSRFIPNIFINMGSIGSPFYTAAVNSISKLKNDKKKAGVLIFWIFIINFILLGLISLFIYVFSEGFASIVTPAANLSKNDVVKLRILTSEQLKILTPTIFFSCLSGTCFGLIHLNKNYNYAQSQQTFMNIVEIIFILLLVGSIGYLSLSVSFSIAFIFGFIFLILGIGVRNIIKDISIKDLLNFNEVKEDIKSYFVYFSSLIAISSITIITIYIINSFCSFLPEGQKSAFEYSTRLIGLPLSLATTSLIFPLFPELSKFAIEKDFENINKIVIKYLLILGKIMIPISIFTFVFSKEIVLVIYKHGVFSENALGLVSTSLKIFSFSLIISPVLTVLSKVFESFFKRRFLTYNAVLGLFLQSVLSVVLIDKFLLYGIISAYIITIGTVTLISFHYIKLLTNFNETFNIARKYIWIFILALACSLIAYFIVNIIEISNKYLNLTVITILNLFLYLTVVSKIKE